MAFVREIAAETSEARRFKMPKEGERRGRGGFELNRDLPKDGILYRVLRLVSASSGNTCIGTPPTMAFARAFRILRGFASDECVALAFLALLLFSLKNRLLKHTFSAIKLSYFSSPYRVFKGPLLKCFTNESRKHDLSGGRF